MLDKLRGSSPYIRSKIVWLNFRDKIRKERSSPTYQAGWSPFTELLTVYNERGQVIGRAPRLAVHMSGLWHRTVHLLLFDSKGNLLIQKRGRRKDQSPGKLASSVGGHVPADKTLEEALREEARQELGIESLTFSPVATFPYISKSGSNKEMVSLFTGTCEGQVVANPTELSWAAWFNFAGIVKLAEQKPDLFAPSFLEDLKQFQKIN